MHVDDTLILLPEKEINKALFSAVITKTSNLEVKEKTINNCSHLDI